MDTPPAKRRRTEIPNSVKKTICQLKVDNPKMTLLDIRSRIIDDIKLSIGKSTIGDIIKEKEKWLSTPTDSDDLTRARHPKHEQLEDALTLWFNDISSRHAAVNDDMLIQKAKELGTKLNITDFNYSRGWLQRFKQRRGISKRKYQGEADSADKTAVHSGREELRTLLKDYDPDNIFNIDETGLFYRLGPNYTLATQTVAGVKKSKDRITVALTANATGTTKLKPFVITKVNRPRCFGKTYNPNLYVRYRYNKKAWMTSTLFTEWLKDFDRQMRLQHRHVILLVDNAASHSSGDLQLTNTKLHFLPPNTTAHIQPMDAGIIRTFKAYYRKQLVIYYLECADNDQPQTVDLRQALHMTKLAWDTVTPKTITNCYRHTGIVPGLDDDADDDTPLIDMISDNLPLNELQQLMQRIPETVTKPEEYLAVDDQEPTGDQLQDDDILDLVTRCDDIQETQSDDEDDDTSDPIRSDITLSAAKHHLQQLISYMEQTPTTTEETDYNRTALETLWDIQRRLQQKSTHKQTTLMDFWIK